jgi:major membrane immunogen (membrane-anchored lipoprotein)
MYKDRQEVQLLIWKRNLWRAFILLFATSLLLAACSRHEDHSAEARVIVSNVVVTDKGTTDDGHYWILAVYPDKKKFKSTVKLNVEETLWGTVAINRKYTIHYVKQVDGTYDLHEIRLLTD